MIKNTFKNFVPSYFNHGNLCVPSAKDMDTVRSILSGCELIFFASVGREGSGYVGNLFSGAQECTTYHERRPFANGGNLIQKSMLEPYNSHVINRIKLAKIADDIFKAEAKIYVESNHMFIKTFGRELLNVLDVKFTLVSLRRPLVDTLKSFTDLDWFGRSYNRASNWIYKIDINTPLKRVGLSIDGQIDETIGYMLSEKLNETNFILNDKNKKINYIKVNIPPQSSDIQTLKQLVGVNNTTFELISKKNTRTSLKNQLISKQQCEEAMISFLKKNSLALSEQGIFFNCEKKIIKINNFSWNIT